MEHTISLKQNHEFRRLYSKGKSVVSPYFVIYCRRTGRPVNRLGITTAGVYGRCTAPRNKDWRPVMILSLWPEPG